MNLEDKEATTCNADRRDRIEHIVRTYFKCIQRMLLDIKLKLIPTY